VIEIKSNDGYFRIGNYLDHRINDERHLSNIYNLPSMQRKKKEGVDETLPEDPFNDPNLEDITHPDAKGRGNHKFKDKRTGKELRFDEGDPQETGHEAHDHYHRPNPNSNGKKDYYFDNNGNPVPKGSDPSHLYRPEAVWWL